MIIHFVQYRPVKFLQINSGHFLRRMPQTFTDGMKRGTVFTGHCCPAVTGSMQTQRNIYIDSLGNLFQCIPYLVISFFIPRIRSFRFINQREKIVTRSISIPFQQTLYLPVNTYFKQLAGLLPSIADYPGKNIALFRKAISTNDIPRV